MVTTVMHLEGDSEDNAHFTTVHESSNHLLKMGILDTNKVSKIMEIKVLVTRIENRNCRGRG